MIEVSIHLMLLFIAHKNKFFYGGNISFNTSHVVIYLPDASSLYILLSRFNTSHVVIYHIIVKTVGVVCIVSIHLMLLFIKIFTVAG